MAHEPKKKHSKADKRTRRAAIKLDEIKVVVCSNCQAKIWPHMACSACGFYAGRQRVNPKVSVTVAKG